MNTLLCAYVVATYVVLIVVFDYVLNGANKLEWLKKKFKQGIREESK